MINPTNINEGIINIDAINHFKETLAASNIQEKNRVQVIFEKSLEGVSSEHCCIFVTGSHGRKEKVGQATFELIVAFNKGLSEDQKQFIKSKIENIVMEHKTEFDRDIEYQTLGSDSKVIGYKEKIIPTRAFDSMRIWGSKIIKKDYYTSMFYQLSSLNSIEYRSFSKNFRQSTIRHLNDNMKVEENKENQIAEKKPFNLETGILFYDGEKNRASKFPFLRTVQYQLAHLIFQQVKSKKMTEVEFNELRKQRSVPKKLEWMLEKNIIKISQVELKKIANAYMISLIWYELAERKYLQGNKEMQVDLNQLKEITNTISKFAK